MFRMGTLEEMEKEVIVVCRTNFFRVTDEDEYNLLFESIGTENYQEVRDLTQIREEDGSFEHAFGAFDTIIWEDKDFENGFFDEFIPRLQEILPDDEVFVLHTVTINGLSKIDSSILMVTNDNMEISHSDKVINDLVWELTKHERMAPIKMYN